MPNGTRHTPSTTTTASVETTLGPVVADAFVAVAACVLLRWYEIRTIATSAMSATTTKTKNGLRTIAGHILSRVKARATGDKVPTTATGASSIGAHHRGAVCGRSALLADGVRPTWISDVRDTGRSTPVEHFFRQTRTPAFARTGAGARTRSHEADARLMSWQKAAARRTTPCRVVLVEAVLSPEVAQER